MGERQDRKRRTWLVVIICVTTVVLVGVAFRVERRVQSLHRRLVCAANIKCVETSIKVYAGDHPGEPAALIRALIERGDLNAAVAVCPVSGEPYLFGPLAGNRDGGPIDSLDVLVYEPLDYHHGAGANVLYGDGHAEFVSPSEFKHAIGQQKRPSDNGN